MMNDWWLGKKVDFALFSEKLRQWGKLCVTGGCDGRNKVHLWVKKSVWMLEDENVNVILFYFPQKHFAMTIKRDSDGNKKHKMLSTKKERENVFEAMILGRKK